MKPHLILKENENLEKFFDSVKLGILFVNSSGIIKGANNAATNLFNQSEERLIEKNIELLFEGGNKEKFLKSFQNLVSTDSLKDEVKIELFIKNSEEKKISTEVSINASISNINDSYIFLINDISKRKDLEAEIKEQEFEKEEIEEKLEKAQELSQLKSRFVSMASHEFRTPLAGILSSINLATKYLDAEEKNGTSLFHKSKIENHFLKIRKSVGNLTEILNEFLSLGKLEEGQINCHWEAIKLEKVANESVDNLRKLCKNHQRIIIKNSLAKDNHILDKNMILNILNNLLSNAIKYSGEGSEIFLRLIDQKNQTIIEVADEGIGIPKADQKKLFSRFFRATNVTNIQGTGLGLNILRRYTELMGGAISFTSELNKGTIFTIKIPHRDAI